MLPLDGGRAMAAMAPWMWFVGFAVLVAAAILFPNPIMLLILLFGGMETWRRWKAAEPGRRRAGGLLPGQPRDRALVVGVVYVGLIVVLAVGMDATFLDHSDRL